MLVIPAIDIIDGKCVRLTEGVFSNKTVYDKDPLETALFFKESGAKRVHIIDLDGAKTGSGKNRQIIKNIKKETGIEIESGGGIRTESDIKELLDAGIDYLILGTLLAEETALAEKWIKAYGAQKFIAGIDVKNNVVKTKGWLSGEGLDPVLFGKKVRSFGIVNAVYTNISKDGKLEGPDIEGTKNFSEGSKLKVILSGGVTAGEDIEKAKNIIGKNLFGVIVGKAFYEGKIDIKNVIKLFQD